MKKTLLAGLVIMALMISLSPTAQADAFLNINGATCNNTSLATIAATCALTPGFTTLVGSNSILFTGTVGNFTIQGVALSSNSAGTAALGTANDTKLSIQNNAATVQTLTISFAENNFALPLSPDVLSGSQSVTLATGATTQMFTASADAGNSLTPGAGTSTNTTSCSAAGVSQSCNANNTPTGFTHGGLFSLSGVETITLNSGGISNYTGTVNVTPQVPEPSSLILLGSGMILVASRKFRQKK